MKKVVDGKLYDTDTALFLHQWDNGLGNGDFNHCDETLYRTGKGRYFLAGTGGAMTRWSRPDGNARTGGSGIMPLSASEALEWAETRDMPVEKIYEHFEERIEVA